MEQTCKKCGETKTIEEFAKNCKYINGKYYINYRNYCLLCYNEIKRIKYNENVELERKRQRERWAQNRDKLVREKRERRMRNKQKYKETDRKWNEANRDKRRNQVYKYKKRYPDRVKETAKRSRDKSAREVSDTYVKKIINRNYDISFKSITKELIRSYRQQIKVKRLLKQKKNDIKTS